MLHNAITIAVTSHQYIIKNTAVPQMLHFKLKIYTSVKTAVWLTKSLDNCLSAAVLSGFSKEDPELLVRLSSVLNIMMADENVAVVKKLVLCMAQIYRSALLVSISICVLS